MTICRDWSLVKYEAHQRHCRPLYCRSWSCEVCQPRRRAQLMAQAAGGNPNRFLTLTVNPAIGDSPSDRLRLLARAWRVAVQRLRRAFPGKTIDYLAIVEETKQGEPHLHLLLRAPFIPQGLISAIMGELIESPIVDIRAIKNVRHVIRYVAKYITKAPAQFGTAKRYWCSRTWEAAPPAKTDEKDPLAAKWEVEQRSIHQILSDWLHSGWMARKERDELIVAWPQWEPPPNAVAGSQRRE